MGNAFLAAEPEFPVIYFIGIFSLDKFLLFFFFFCRERIVLAALLVDSFDCSYVNIKDTLQLQFLFFFFPQDFWEDSLLTASFKSSQEYFKNGSVEVGEQKVDN